MSNFIRTPPNSQNITRAPRVRLGNILLAHDGEKIVEWQGCKIAIEPPPVAPTERIIDRVIHDRHRERAKFGDQSRAEKSALIDPNQAGLESFDGFENRTVDL